MSCAICAGVVQWRCLRGGGEVPRQAHNLEALVQFQPPQHGRNSNRFPKAVAVCFGWFTTEGKKWYAFSRLPA